MLPFLAATGIALAVVVGVRGEKWPRSAAFLYQVLLGGSALALTLYVASEDDYRRGGISRWNAYDAQEPHRRSDRNGSGCCGRVGQRR